MPTWNYQSVHIYGRASIFTEVEKLKWVVKTLTHKYESAFSQPWKANYNASMLGGIIGIEIAINDLQCKYKLSQNRSVLDRSQVRAELNAQGSTRLAEAMAKNEIESFD